MYAHSLRVNKQKNTHGINLVDVSELQALK
jgi:hypothetical protein